jgi:hypothetical protein
VYKLDSFVGFIGDEQFHAQECYAGGVVPLNGKCLRVQDCPDYSGSLLLFLEASEESVAPLLQRLGL